MILRACLILSFALLSFEAQAQEIAVCDSFKETPTKIDVLLDDKKFWNIDRFSSDELKYYREKNFNKWKYQQDNQFWISDADKSIGGFYRAGMGIDITYGFTIKHYEGQGEELACVFIDYVKATVHFNGGVFMDSVYDQLECREIKELSYEHIRKRYSIGVGAAINAQVGIIKELPKILPEMEYAAVKREDALEKVDRIKEALQARMTFYENEMRNEIIEINENFAVPEDLENRFSQCVKEIPVRYKDKAQ